MPSESLAQALQAQHERAIIRQAETIRDWSISRERREQAEIHIRSALWERGLGRISDETQYRVYSILSFVMPRDAAFENEVAPLAELEPEPDIEAAYYEQLDRQSCPECGDGICPVEEPDLSAADPMKIIYHVEHDGVTGVIESPDDIDPGQPLAKQLIVKIGFSRCRE
jgi:hypothetical protein